MNPSDSTTFDYDTATLERNWRRMVTAGGDELSMWNEPPPYDLDAEAACLSALWLAGDDAERFNAIRSEIWPQAFFDPDHQQLCSIIFTMADLGEALNKPNLRGRLQDHEVSGAAAVLGSNYSSVFGVSYARQVARDARARAGIQAGLALASRIQQGGNADTLLAFYAGKLDQIVKSGTTSDIFSLGDILAKFVEMKEATDAERPLIITDTALDQYPGVMCLGEYTIMGGRPSMGKSTAVRWLLGNIAKRGVPVGLIAVEESGQKIAGNYISADAEVENHYVAHGKLDGAAWSKILPSVDRLSALPWWGTDAAFSLSQVTAAFESLVLRKKCKVIAVDHLHLIDNDQLGSRRGENREFALSEISRALKNLAKKHHVCCIAAAQLSRPDKSKTPAPPELTDLRGSGGIEEHADGVIFLHREDYYHRDDPNWTRTRVCIFKIAKNRNGEVGSVTLRAELDYQRFSEIVDVP